MKKCGERVILLLLFMLCAMGIFGFETVYGATDSLSIVQIDYEKGIMTIQANEEDKKVFFASKINSAVWDEVYGDFNGAKQIDMDISWASKTANVVFYIKGDVSETPVKVTLPKQNSAFKVSLNTATSEVTFSGAGTVTLIYWRKAVSSVWNRLELNNTEDMKAFKNEVERFSLQGITLYFRTGQEIGTNNTIGARPSKEVTLKIAKRAAAPSVKADYSKFTIAVKNTMEYKISTNSEWIEISGNSLSFEEIAMELLYKDETEEGFSNSETLKDVSIDFRTKATQTKVASRITTIKIPAQEPTEFKIDDIIQFVGEKQLTITIDNIKDEADNSKILVKGASATNPYEYTIVKSDAELNISTAVWTAITSTEPVAVSSTKAPVGSTIYIRKKATTAVATAPIKRVISEEDYPEASSLEYPEEKDKVELEKIRGVKCDLTTETLSFNIKVPTKDTKVSSITFAGKAVGFVQSNDVDDSNNIITVTITDVSAAEAVSSNIDTSLKGVITLNNGDKIEKDITLFIIPAASLVSKSIQIFKGLDAKEDLKLELLLNHNTKADVTVQQVEINGSTLEAGVDFNQDPSANQINITIESEFLNEYAKEESTPIGTAIPVIITLDNNEVIKTGVTITTKYVATIERPKGSTGIGISGSSSTIADPILTVTIDKTLFAQNMNFSIKKALWNGVNILSYCEELSDVFTVVLSLQKVITASSEDNYNYDGGVVQIELEVNSEPVLLDSAYKITVLQ